MSCTGSTECPLPNKCTKPPRTMQSAITAEAFSMLPVCVSQIRFNAWVIRSRYWATLTNASENIKMNESALFPAESKINSVNAYAFRGNFCSYAQSCPGRGNCLICGNLANPGRRLLQFTAEVNRRGFIRMIEEEDQSSFSRLHLAKLQQLRRPQIGQQKTRPSTEDRRQWMQRDGVVIILLAGEAAEDDGTSFVITVLKGNRCAFARECNRSSQVVLHLKLFLKPGGLELRRSPFHFELFSWNELFFMHAQHFIPAKARDLWLGVAAFIHPAGSCLAEQMSSGRDVILQSFGFFTGQHQRIRNDHELVLPKIVLLEFPRTQDVYRQIPFEEHPVITSDGLMNNRSAAFLVIAT